MTEWNCSEPFNNVYIEQREEDVRVAPCCVTPTYKFDPAYSLFDQPSLVAYRDAFNNQQVPAGCNWCVKNESQGIRSRRQDAGQKEKANKLTNLEINTGNFCNLKCVICDNLRSSAWYNDAVAMGLPTWNNTKNSTWQDHIKLDEDTRVQWIHFNGGEPLLTDVHITLLEKIQDKSKVRLYYNTNGTIRVKDHVLALWEKFNVVQLIFSIDDIGERFNYQRTNADWDTVESNLLWYIKNSPVNMMFGINRAISRLNQHYLNDLDQWFKHNFSHNRLGDPCDFSNQTAYGICALDSPDEEFQKYIDKLDSIRR
jgi:organic radical activating enzyme